MEKLHLADWVVCAFTQYRQGKEIKEGVMGGACSTCGGRREIHTGFLNGKKPKGKGATWKT